MRLCWVVEIVEQYSRVCGVPLPNRVVCAVFGIAQLLVALTSLGQHVFSWYRHRHVFFCQSNISDSASFDERILAYDMIIFDFGLMNRVLGTTECVANYLDGGYMRAMWCIEHATALTILMLALLVLPRPTWLLWPGEHLQLPHTVVAALMMQSAYALGMSVLTMATAPKVLEAFGGTVDAHLWWAFVIYAGGFLLNWLFTFVLWHHFWYMERLNQGYEQPGQS